MITTPTPIKTPHSPFEIHPPYPLLHSQDPHSPVARGVCLAAYFTPLLLCRYPQSINSSLPGGAGLMGKPYCISPAPLIQTSRKTAPVPALTHSQQSLLSSLIRAPAFTH